MSKRQANKLRDSDIVGLKYFDRLMPLLERLHDVGTQRDRAGNRRLFFDHYCAYILLFLFNPVVTSLRGIQQASELKRVQKKLGCPRASLGSLSEAAEVFDPEPVKQIASELAGQLEPLAQQPPVSRGQAPGHRRGRHRRQDLVAHRAGGLPEDRPPTADRSAPGGCTPTSTSNAACPCASTSPAPATRAKTTNGPSCVRRWKPTAVTSWIAATPSSRCSTPSRRTAAATSAASATTASTTSSSNGR